MNAVTDVHGVVSFAADNPMYVLAAVVIFLLATFVVWRVVRAAVRAARTTAGRSDDVLTLVVAALATGMSAQGMWRFFDDVLEMPPLLRVLMFGVFELAMFTSALRARRSIADPQIGTAGVDGAAVWIMAALSGVLSALDAGSFGGVLARLAAPLVAAWLWERGLSIERRRSGRSVIHWRITPERALVRLRLAEATDRTAGDVDAHRRLTRLAKAAMKVRTLRACGARPRRLRRAECRLDAAMTAAVEHARLASDVDRRQALLAQLGALYHAAGLAGLTLPSPWTYTRGDAHPYTSAYSAASVPDGAARTDGGQPGRTDGDGQSRTERPTRTRTRPDIRKDVDREALVAELAADILAAAAASDKWLPDYDRLMERTGAGKSWCEKVVRDAKLAVFRTDEEAVRAALPPGSIRKLPAPTSLRTHDDREDRTDSGEPAADSPDTARNRPGGELAAATGRGEQ